MVNEYWKIPAELIKEVQERGTTDSPYPHKNVHWRLSVDKTKAIVQGDFDDETIAWLGKQTGASKLGNYLRGGKAEKKVYDYIKLNKVEWENEESVKSI